MEAIVLITVLLLLMAPAVEIAVRRPKTLLDLLRARDLRAFAEMPLRTQALPRAVANDDGFAPTRSEKERLAA